MTLRRMLLIVTAVGLLGCGHAQAVLVAHYTFDDADIAGKTALDVMNTNDAAPTGSGGGARILTTQPGYLGDAFRFSRDDAGNLLEHFENLLAVSGGVAPSGAAERTFATWFRQTATNGENKLFGYGSTNNDEDATTAEGFAVSLEGSGIRVRNSNGYITYGEGFDFLGSDAGWRHLAVRVNAGATDFSGVDVFVDGIQLPAQIVLGDPDEDLADTLVTASTQFGIGGDVAFPNNGFTGLLDDFRIYDNAISNGEIQSLASVAAAPSIALTVDRDSGSMSLSRTGNPVGIAGYRILSDSGSLNEAGWSSIADFYDATGTGPDVGSVDSDDDWVKLPAGAGGVSISEALVALGGGNGGVLTSTDDINLSQSGGLWVRTPTEDVEFELLLDDGSVVLATVLFEGNGGAPYLVGDFDFDGDVDTIDYMTLSSNLFSTFAAPGPANYLLGDIDLDGDVDRYDFGAFKDSYIALSGPVAFQAMLQGTAAPEPSAAGLAALSLLLFAAASRTRISGGLSMTLLYGWRTSLPVLALFAASALAPTAHAVLVAHYTFDDVDIVSGKGARDIVGGADALPTGANGGQNIQTGEPGVFGQAYSFTRDSIGNDTTPSQFENLLRTPSGVVPFGSAARTIVVWFNSAEDDPDSQDKLFGYGSTNTDGNGATGEALDISLEDGAIRLRNSSGNIFFGESGEFDFTPTGVDAGWHSLAVRVNNGASTYADIDVFLDGDKLAPRLDNGLADPDLSDALSIPNSPFGIGSVGYDAFLTEGFNGLLDDLKIYNHALSDAEIPVPPALTLSLEVNTSTGAVAIKNESAFDFEIDYYDIASVDEEDDGGSLVVENWQSLQNQNLPGFPAGDGSGNGWEEGGGSNPELLGEAILGTSGASGDYNGDNVVDAADYALWRNTLNDSVPNGTGADGDGDGVVDQDDYDLWRENYGATGGTGQMASLFASGMTPIDLGLLFDASDSQDLVFTYRLTDGTFVSGKVKYVASGLSASTTAPEPTAAAALAVLLCLMALTRLRAQPRLQLRPSTVNCVCLGAVFALAAGAAGASELDRRYLLGDEEGGVDGGAVSVTWDGAGETNMGQLHDLAGFNGPEYENVSSTGLDRPGASPGAIGILFNGTSDFLRGQNLNRPSQSAAATAFDYSGIDHRGFELWVRPSSDKSGVLQNVVMDSTQHGVSITGGETPTWQMKFGNSTVTSSAAVAFDEWTHVMVVNPRGNASFMYIDGVAVAASAAGYADSTEFLVLGSGSSPLGNWFSGVLDDMYMFVIGESDQGADYGAFDFPVDNDFAAQFLGIEGDISGAGGMPDGNLDQRDVDAFVAGWEQQRNVNGQQVGDLVSYGNGDLNFDGVTDLLDAFAMNSALLNAGVAALDFSLLGASPTPEPTSLAALTVLAACATKAGARRRGVINA